MCVRNQGQGDYNSCLICLRPCKSFSTGRIACMCRGAVPVLSFCSMAEPANRLKYCTWQSFPPLPTYLPTVFFCYFICIKRFSLLSQTSRNGPISSHILNFFLQPANRFYAATLAAEVIYNLLLFFLEKNCNFLNRWPKYPTSTHTLKLLSASIKKMATKEILLSLKKSTVVWTCTCGCLLKASLQRLGITSHG